MSAPLFDGVQIFGINTREHGPIPSIRTQREIIPGVAGYRNYRLGANHATWNLTGRLVYTTRALLEAALQLAEAYVDGAFYTFTSKAGTAYANCELVDYRPVGPPQLITESGVSKYTVEVAGVIQWAAPT